MCVLARALKFLLHRKIPSGNKSATSTIRHCRDETKRYKRAETKRTKIVNNVNNLTTAMLEEPGLWIRPEFQLLRNFVDAVSRNTATFPKNARAPSTIHENADDALLSNKFAQQVESGSIL